MKTKTVADHMVPFEAYAVVTGDATMLGAVLAPETAQMEFKENRYRHRAVLVTDQSSDAIGKISQHDLIEALEPNYQKIKSRAKGAPGRFGFSDLFIKTAMEEFSFRDKPLQNICEKAYR